MRFNDEERHKVADRLEELADNLEREADLWEPNSDEAIANRHDAIIFMRACLMINDTQNKS